MAHHAQCGERILAAIRVHGSAEEIQSCAALTLWEAQLDVRLEEEQRQWQADSEAAEALERVDDEKHAQCMGGLKLPPDDWERLVVSLYGAEQGALLCRKCDAPNSEIV